MKKKAEKAVKAFTISGFEQQEINRSSDVIFEHIICAVSGQLKLDEFQAEWERLGLTGVEVVVRLGTTWLVNCSDRDATRLYFHIRYSRTKMFSSVGKNRKVTLA
jgi:low affinity Fe/Cu permease